MTLPGSAVVSVANRLPVSWRGNRWELAPGGLVTALKPVMESRRGAWVGWDGGSRRVPDALPSLQIEMQPVRLGREAVEGFYHGFSNRTLWPLLHNAIERPVFDRHWWSHYQDVNRRFGAVAHEVVARHDDALLWVHDYHLMLVPEVVRALSPNQPIGYFLHVPWPAPDIFARLPWRTEVLHGLLGADVVSFHTDRYRKNFVRSVGRLLGAEGISVRGTDIHLPDGRVVRTTAAPISIDAVQIAASITTPAANAHVAELRERFGEVTVLLGVDRLDYTKGIIERLLAFERLLEQRPDLVGQIVLVQIAVPSRDDVEEYRLLRERVEHLIGRINGRFTRPGGEVPIHYLYRGLDPAQLYAYYAVADLMLVTPLIDGMNLVAKEFVVAQHAYGGTGVLLLSEFTGAADELREAVLCNPFDIDGLVTRIKGSLAQPDETRRRNLRTMARRIQRRDVHWWLEQQLTTIADASRVR